MSNGEWITDDQQQLILANKDILANYLVTQANQSQAEFR